MELRPPPGYDEAVKTVDDFRRLPEGARAELIEGELVMSPSPKERHQRILLNLTLALDAVVRPPALGRLYTAPFDVHLPSGDIVQPDLIFVSTANRGIIQDWIRGVPDLLVEILSPDSSQRDRVLKRALYERNGVPRYWIVDPEQPSVELLTLSGGVYVAQAPSPRLQSPAFPGLDLPLQALIR